MVGSRLWDTISGLSLGEGQSATVGDNYYLQLDADGNGVAALAPFRGTLFFIH